MTTVPRCPYCDTPIDEPVPESIDGPITLRCKSCEERFEYDPDRGSYPIEGDFSIRITKGPLSSVVMTNESVTSSQSPEPSVSSAIFVGLLCCCIIAVIIPIAFALLLSIFG
ncbi:MAG: hypothetical protein ACFFCP_01125 [Promethearchaeota archaeon]